MICQLGLSFLDHPGRQPSGGSMLHRCRYGCSRRRTQTSMVCRPRAGGSGACSSPNPTATRRQRPRRGAASQHKLARGSEEVCGLRLPAAGSEKAGRPSAPVSALVSGPNRGSVDDIEALVHAPQTRSQPSASSQAVGPRALRGCCRSKVQGPGKIGSAARSAAHAIPCSIVQERCCRL